MRQGGLFGLLVGLPARLAGFSARRPRVVAAFVIVLVALSLGLVISSKFQSDISRLVPRKAEKTSLYFSLMEEFGAMEKLYVVFSAEDVRGYTGAADKVGEALLASGYFRSVRWRITPEMRDFMEGPMYKKLPLYLTPAQMEEFRRRLSPGGIREELEKTLRRLSLPGGKSGMKDPLGLSDLLKEQVKLSELPFDLATGYFITPDHMKLIISASPTGSPRDLEYSGRLVSAVDEILKRNVPAGLSAEVTGRHAISVREAGIVKMEMLKNFLTALIGVLVVFALFFRGLRGLLVAVLPVILGVLVTAGLGRLMIGSITEVSGGFFGLLIGLGVDLGIVLYVRYAFNSLSGLGPGQALDEGIKGAGTGITVGVLTTAATFFPMLLSSFRGIRELGLLTGTGILLAWCMLFLLFPLLAPKVVTRPPGSRLRLVERVFLWAYNNHVLTFALVGMVTLALVIFVPSVKVHEDVTKLGAENNPPARLLKDLKKKYMDHKNIVFTGTADDPLLASEAAYAIAQKLQCSFSIADILPPPSVQRENLDALASIDAAGVVEDFKDAANWMGFSDGVFDAYLKNLRGMLENRETMTFDDIGPLGHLTERVLKNEGVRYRFIVSGSLEDPSASAAAEAIKPLEAMGVDVSYTGPPMVRAELLSHLWDDALLITVVGILAVNALLFMDFRRPLYVLLSQLPVIIAVVWLLGLMGLMGIGLNFMNAIVFVMLFGIGTDYCIHLLHRYRWGGDITEIARETGKAVVLAGLTTLAGFGSMANSAYRGLASLGAATALGIISCVVLTVTLMPAFFRLFDNAREKSAHD